jgi:thioredoxin 1
MEDKPKETIATRHFIKIVIPIIIVAVIGAIWFFKNVNERPPVTDNNSALEDENPDFALHVTGSLDLAKLQTYKLPLLIDFGADTCPPCRRMASVLEELNRELRGKAIVKYVDVAQYQEIAEKFPFSVIPTQFFFDKEGKPFVPQNAKERQMILHYNKDTNKLNFTSHEGAMTKEELLAVFKEMGVE